MAATLVPVGTAAAASVVVVDVDGAASPASCDATDPAPRTVTAAIASVDPGGTVRVCPGRVVEPGQVVVARDVTVRAFDPARVPTLVAGADTGTVGDDRGWWLVRPGATLRLRDLRLDGTDRLIHQGVRFRGRGEVRDVTFTDIAYNAAGPDRSGFAVVAFGDGPVSVTDTTFRRIGRVGAFFFGPATAGSVFARNNYVGKGPGTHLDYGVEIGDGSRVRVEDSVISQARGQVDGTVSAGVLVSTAFGGDTGLTLTGSRLSRNANGVFLDDGARRGFGGIAIARNAFLGNEAMGIARAGGSTVDATCNWWGATGGPASGGGGVSPGVVTVPFLTSADLDGRCSADPLLTADVAETTVNEGSPAQVTGTFTAGSPEPVELTASSGTLETSGSNVGTWTWTDTPADGPGDGTTVAVTGDNGRTGATSFDLRVRNAVPTATFDAPSTAFSNHPFVLSVLGLNDPSPVDRAAGLTVAFDCSDGSGYGAAGTATSTQCSVERGGRRTVRALLADKDGGTRELTKVVEVYAPDGNGAPDRSATGTVADGGTVATGTGEATPLDPVVTRVRVPVGGEVTIEEGPPAVAAPSEHALLAWGAHITAPPQSIDAPLEMLFRLDPDLLPEALHPAGVLAISVVLEGELVPPCGEAGGAGLPCVAHRWTSGDDAVLEVRATAAGAVGFVFPTVACAEGSTPTSSFPDVHGTVHEAAVACAERWELVRGLGPATYAPTGTVTRAQVATVVAGVLALAGVELPAEPADRFSDDDGSVHELAIGQLAELGVMEGRTATTFAPAAPLTRAQFASTLARAASVLGDGPLPAGEDRFVDDDGNVHEANIDAVAAAGLANGVTEDRFDPRGAVRRDQTASFLTRLLSAWYADARS